MIPPSPETEAIISTLAFFAMFSRPLTAQEIVRYAYTSKKEKLQKEELCNILSRESVYWYKSHEYYYLTAAKYVRSMKEMDIATHSFVKKGKKYLSLLRYVPYIRFVGIVNTVAFGSTKPSSDIDLFIVTKANKIWIARLLVTVLLHIVGVRRHGAKTQGRFCLSFFVDEEMLGLSSIALPDDVYLAFWLATMLPIWDVGVYERLLDANKGTLLRDLPFWYATAPLIRKPQSVWQRFMEALATIPPFRWFESPLIMLQKKKMANFPVKQNEYSSVVVSDHMLKFHNNDRRSRYKSTWESLVFKSISQL